MGDQGPGGASPARPQNPRFSTDGYWWWDGADWRPAVSADRLWRLDGAAWVAVAKARPPSSSRRAGLLIGLTAAGAIVILVVFSVLAFFTFNGLNSMQRMARSRTPAAGIPCDLLEHTQVHYHAALQILNQGNPVDIPTGVGRSIGCFYWLHMHDFEPGIIHVEAPSGRTFTLGDFFAVWSAWGGVTQPLDSTRIASVTLTAGQKLIAYVDPGDDSGPQVFGGDPKTIVLKNREEITLEITPPVVVPPPAFSWPSGF